MSYSIDRYNGTTLTVVEDGTIDNTLDIKLIGKNYAGYGEVQNENFVHLLEHFSSAGPAGPQRKISGQIWFDSSLKKLKFYDGNNWRTTGGAEIGGTAPTSLTEGDFWWDNTNDQLYAFSGTEFILIGPQGVTGSGTTQMKSRSVKATSGTGGALMPIIQAIVDDTTIYIISKESFVIDTAVPGNNIPGFGIIKAGITLADTNNEDGVTTSLTEVFHGTATNALRLGGFAAGDFLGILNYDFTPAINPVLFNADGLTIGGTSGAGTDTLAINITSSNPVVKSATALMTFQTTSGTVKTPLTLSGNDILPGADQVSNIGSASFKYATVYANAFNGPASQADSLNVGGIYRTATASATVHTIAARDNSGNLTANLFQGIATQARYADLAEKYLADAEYETGTVVVIGGEKEVTASSWGKRAVGVVSANPAYMMNSELEGGTYIALKGRVPVKVIGAVRKGDSLIAANNGCASVGVHHSNDVFAIALQNSDDTGIKLVEALVL
jgi:hypothetical protein